jgi:predicted PurR-regulated permease PerM
MTFARPSDHRFIRRIALAVLILGLALLAWYLIDVLLLVFASILLAVILRSLADLIEKIAPINSSWSLALVIVLSSAIIAGGSVLFGAQISQQIGVLVEQLPTAWDQVWDKIGEASWLNNLLKQIGASITSTGTLVSRLGGLLGHAIGAVTGGLLVLFAGLYFAAQPRLYLDGALAFFPRDNRPQVEKTLLNCGTELRHWLAGQLVSMLTIGAMATAGLLLLGMPSALALGIFAGLAEFVPIVGPIMAAIPALIIAFSLDGSTALWVLGLFVVIQQIEGNIIQPIVQRQMVRIAPAVTLFAILAFGVLFGALGLLLAAPLTVVVRVLIRDLYTSRLE